MKIVKAGSLDLADRRRFAELRQHTDVDQLRELEYEALVFNSAFVRHTWRKQKQSGAGRGRKSEGL